MADIVKCPCCEESVEWPMIVTELKKDVYEIGCVHCMPEGKQLVGDFWDEDYTNRFKAIHDFEEFGLDDTIFDDIAEFLKKKKNDDPFVKLRKKVEDAE